MMTAMYCAISDHGRSAKVGYRDNKYHVVWAREEEAPEKEWSPQDQDSILHVCKNSIEAMLVAYLWVYNHKQSTTLFELVKGSGKGYSFSVSRSQ